MNLLFSAWLFVAASFKMVLAFLLLHLPYYIEYGWPTQSIGYCRNDRV